MRRPPEPESLSAYRTARPNGTWEQMRNDPHDGGQQAYLDVKESLVKGQRCLCAYCEMRVEAGTGAAEIRAAKNLQRVEHFHPKSDTIGATNWALHWPNLWAVCLGGSQKPADGIPHDSRNYLPPLPENLRCDSHKDYQIQNGRLDINPEGWILAPDQVPAFPRLFQYAPDGAPEPDRNACSGHPVPGNRHPDTVTLVDKTIEHLNLGCERLKRNRRVAKAQLEKEIANLRQKHVGADPRALLLDRARKWFPSDQAVPWSEFFTLVRWRLGEPAEERLREMGFTG
ncbi:retron system putative HNH endonuclease [Fimbriiglobus ruber]|uniref:retron system putative HNH endonuclease n=1 Tax=Fimbriiglobus ruber TaxID=1908690 RepID=UPI00117AAB7D|nr:retron system putative HNH endonuclease [Fimbriiglobus ruber]